MIFLALFSFLAFLSVPPIAVAQPLIPAVETATATTSVITESSIRDLPLDATTTVLLIEHAAAKYGVNEARLEATLNCESEGFQDKQSDIPNRRGPNGFEDSWGVAQIHLPAHKDITLTEALDVEWSVDWAARQFAAGDQWMWTCYRLLYGQ